MGKRKGAIKSKRSYIVDLSPIFNDIFVQSKKKRRVSSSSEITHANSDDILASGASILESCYSELDLVRKTISDSFQQSFKKSMKTKLPTKASAKTIKLDFCSRYAALVPQIFGKKYFTESKTLFKWEYSRSSQMIEFFCDILQNETPTNGFFITSKKLCYCRETNCSNYSFFKSILVKVEKRSNKMIFKVRLIHFFFVKRFWSHNTFILTVL